MRAFRYAFSGKENDSSMILGYHGAAVPTVFDLRNPTHLKIIRASKVFLFMRVIYSYLQHSKLKGGIF